MISHFRQTFIISNSQLQLFVNLTNLINLIRKQLTLYIDYTGTIYKDN